MKWLFIIELFPLPHTNLIKAFIYFTEQRQAISKALLTAWANISNIMKCVLIAMINKTCKLLIVEKRSLLMQTRLYHSQMDTFGNCDSIYRTIRVTMKSYFPTHSIYSCSFQIYVNFISVPPPDPLNF